MSDAPEITHDRVEAMIRAEPSKVAPTERKLGRYELLYELGSGGMASVFLARARGPAGFRKHFAIKRVHENLARDRAFVDMFLDEARIAAAIEHPNVAQVIDLGEADGRYFLAMEYLHGESLVTLLVRSLERGRPIDPSIAAYVAARVAEGLHHAHMAKDARGEPMNLVHRDVSPHNVFITYDGRVKLTDFGVAKAAGRLTSTETGELKGKLAYCSPEQARGDAIDRRTDVFALGVVLWEILTGRRLFKAQSQAETVWRIVRGEYAPASSIVPELPAELDRIIARALAPEADDRYPTALEMMQELDAFLAARKEPSGAPVLAAFMRDLFGPEIERRNATLYDDAGQAPPPAPVGAREGSQSRVGARPERGLWRWAVVGLVAPILAAAAVAMFVTTRESVVRVESSPPGARVWIDDRLLADRTPALSESIERGPHRIAIERYGYARLEERFDADRERLALEYRLVPLAATEEPVAIEARPAEVVRPEEPSGAPPEVAEVGASTNAAEASEAPARSPAGARAPASLTLITRPWARVWLGNRELGTTPFTNREVPSGRLRLRVQPEGRGETRTIVIQAAPGERVSRNIDLDE